MLIQPIFRIIIGTLIMLPVFRLYRKYNDKNILDLINEKSEKLAKAISVVFIIYFFYFTVVTLARLDLFAGTIVFPETDVEYMIVFAVILCCYGAYLGLEPLGRCSVISGVLVIPALIFIMLTLVNKVDFLNLTPIFYNGVTSVVKVAVDSVGQTVEYGIIALMIPRVTGNFRKGYFIWLFSQVSLMAVMFFLPVRLWEISQIPSFFLFIHWHLLQSFQCSLVLMRFSQAYGLCVHLSKQGYSYSCKRICLKLISRDSKEHSISWQQDF